MSEWRRAIKQFFCEHRSVETRRWAEIENGRPIIKGQSRCCDCGKGVLPPTLDYQTAQRMLNEAMLLSPLPAPPEEKER